MTGRKMAYPSNVLHASPTTPGTAHPFPSGLPEFFVRLFTDPGDLVVDPFAGSGTTARVAIRLGRRAIGIEILDEAMR